MPQPQFVYLNTRADFARAASELYVLPDDEYVALDTEFTRVVTYYPVLCLIQLKFGGRIYLIDGLCEGIALIVEALNKRKGPVITFSGSEDLEVLVNEARIHQIEPQLPEKLIDLQVLAGFCGGQGTPGLQACLTKYLDIALDKGETRSDWMLRPLSPSQLKYAACDVEYLEPLHARLKELCSPENYAFFAAEMNELREAALKEPEPKDAYLNIPGAGRLNPRQLSRLQYLCEKRLSYAREHDEALNRVITGKALCKIAQLMPLTPQGLASCQVKWGAVREHGKLVIGWIKEALALPEDGGLKPGLDHYGEKRDNRDAVRRIKHFLGECAQRKGINPDFLTSRSLINDLFYSEAQHQTARLNQGWRRECTGRELKTADFA